MKTYPRQQTEKHPPKGRMRRLLRTAGMAVLAAVLILAGTVYLLLQTGHLQERLRKWAEQAAAANLDAELSIGRVSGSLFGAVTLEDVRLARQGEVILRAGRVRAEYVLPSVIFKGLVLIRCLHVEDLAGNLVQDGSGAWNLAKVLPERNKAPREPAGGLPFLWVQRLSLAGGTVSLIRQGPGDATVRHFTGIRLDAAVRTGRRIHVQVKALQFALDHPSFTLAGLTGSLRFDPAATRLETEGLRLETPRSALHLQGALSLAGAVPEGEAALDLEPLCLAEIGPLLPPGLLDPDALAGKDLRGRIQLAGGPNRLSHQLDLSLDPLTLRAAGEVALDRDGALSLSTGGEVRRLVPDQVPFLAGMGISADIGTRFRLQGEDVNRAHGRWEIALDLHPSRVYGHDIASGSLSLALEPDRLILHPSRLATSLAGLTLEGSLARLGEGAPARRLLLRGEVRELNPEALAPWIGGLDGIDGAVNAALVLEGTLPAGDTAGESPLARIGADLDLTLTPSKVAGLAIQGGHVKGFWQQETVTLQALALDAGFLQVAAAGRVSPAAGTVDLETTVRLADLAALRQGLAGFRPDWAGRLPGPERLSGSASVRGHVTGKWEGPDIAFQADARQIRYEDVEAEAFRLEGTAAGKWPTLSLRLQADATRLRRGEMNVRRLGVRTGIDSRHLTFELDAADGEGRTLQAAGRVEGWADPEKEIRITRLDASLGPSGRGAFDRLVNEGPIELVLAPDRLAVAKLVLSSRDARLAAKGQVSFDGRRPQHLDLSVRHLDLGRLMPLFGLAGQPVTGIAGGRVTLAGTWREPVVAATLAVEKGSGYDFAFSRTEADFQYAEQKLRGRVRVLRREEAVLVLEGEAGLALAIHPFSLEPAPEGLKVDFQSDGLAIAELPLPRFQAVGLDGRLFVRGRMEGSLQRPRVTADIRVADGTLTIARPDLSYERLTAALALEPGRLKLNQVELEGDREGKIVLTGEMELDGFRPGALRLALVGRDVLVPYQKAVDAWVDPDLRLAGRWDAPELAGTIAVSRGRANLDRLFDRGPAEIQVVRDTDGEGGKTVLEDPAASTRVPAVIRNLAVDVGVSVKNDFWLKGKNLDTEIAGRIRLQRAPREKVRLLGGMHTIRGTYRFQGKLFTITRGEITFMGLKEPDPAVDLRAAADIKPVKILVRISGTARNMRLNLSSEPAMDQANIISYLVFGRPVDAVKSRQAFDAERMAMSTAGQMTAAQLNQLFGDIFKLDSINIDTGNGKISEGSVSVGKYITPDVFVTYRQGFELQNPRQEVVVTYEVSPNVSVEAQVGSEENNGLDLFFRFDF